MDLLALIKLITRRWYVVVPIVAASIAVAAWLQTEADEEYEAVGFLLLSPPEFDPARAPRVPVLLGAAVQELRTAEGARSIVAAGGSDEFGITVDGLQVEVTVPGDSPQDVRTAEEVMTAVAELVRAQQVEAGIPDSEQIRWSTAVLTTAEGEEDTETEPEPVEVDGVASEPLPVTLGVLTLEDPTAGRGNPFAAGNATSILLQYAILSDAGQIDVFDRVDDPLFWGFSVAPEGGPGLISVFTTAGDPQIAVRSFDAVHEALIAELDARQDRAEVPTNQRLALEVIAPPSGALNITPPVDRGSLGIVALGVVLAIGMVIIVENVLYRRRVRQHDRDAVLSDEHPAETADLRTQSLAPR